MLNTVSSRCGSLRVAVLVTTALLPAGLAGQSDSRAKAVCAQVPGIAAELTRISGMALRHPVPCDFITKEEINKFLNERVKSSAKPEEVRAEELTLKKFGLVPQNFDLAKNEIDLLTEQAAAFYDYNRKKLFITESTASENQEPVLAHELSHALADQNYNLARYIKQGRTSDDGSTARLAVMEGQATWLMSEFLARKMGQSLESSPEMAKTMAQLGDEGPGQYPVFDNQPLYLRLTLVFPYTIGMMFQDAVIRRDKKEGFGEVFHRAPVTTQQVMHPDKYFSDARPTSPKLPDAHLPRTFKGLVEGTLGELEHSILLEQYLGKERAAQIAPHWRGCNFQLHEDKKAGRIVLLYAVDWDSEDSARQYISAYREVLRKKWKTMSIDNDQEDHVTGTGDDGHFELRRTGATFTSIEGLEK